MRVALATIGSRGEVQPVAALAMRLRSLGHDVRVCVPPDFQDWVADRELHAVALGPPMRTTTGQRAWDLSTPEGRGHAAEDAVAAQFAALPEAARGCDLVVATGAVPVAARSVAELCDARYVHAHYCPTTVPSAHHAPAPWPGWPQTETGDHHELWAADARRWNDTWRAALNAGRASVGLDPVDDVRSHVLTDHPWLAADPTLAPWPEPDAARVFQTGAWLLPDDHPLPAELNAFLDAGDPPVYFGLGSMAAPGDGLGGVLVATARAVGRRAIISRGWADLSLADDGTDCVSIGETNHAALFARVAAVVHHGGAGTTTTAARAGVAQVVVPQVYDQHYWAGRVADLGIGVAHPPGMPTPESLTRALDHALTPEVRDRARALASAVRTDGTLVAAEGLTTRLSTPG